MGKVIECPSCHHRFHPSTRFDDEGKELPRCKDCGEYLNFDFEVKNGNLCTNCGPGSLKAQEREKAEANHQAELKSQNVVAINPNKEK